MQDTSEMLKTPATSVLESDCRRRSKHVHVNIEVTSLSFASCTMNSRGIRTLSKLHSEYVIIRKCVRCASKNHASFSVGDKATLTKTFTNDDVETFAKISMDHNPLHTDPDFAKTTKFGKCIIHGVLINGLISAVCSTKLPGPGSVYLSQETKFVAPAFVNESITAEVEVLEIRKSIMRCSTTAFRTEDNQVLMQGEAKLLIPKVT